MFIIRPESKAHRPSTFEHLKSMKIQSSVLFDIIKLFENMQLQIVLSCLHLQTHIYMYTIVHTYMFYKSNTSPWSHSKARQSLAIHIPGYDMVWALVHWWIAGGWYSVGNAFSPWHTLQSFMPGLNPADHFDFHGFFISFRCLGPLGFDQIFWTSGFGHKISALRSSGQAAQLPNSSPA